MKNVLLVTNGFPFGESEKSFLTTEFSALTQAFNVTLLALDPDVDEITCGGAKRCDVIRENSLLYSKSVRFFSLANPVVLNEIFQAVKKGKVNIVHAIGHITWYYSRSIRMRNIIAELINLKKIDLVYTYWCTPATLGAVDAIHGKNIKLVTRFHGYDLYEERSYESYQPFRKLIANNAEMLVFACTSAKEYFLDRWGEAYSDKSIVSFLGTQSGNPVFHYDKNCLRVISCSWLIPRKRVDLLINSFARLDSSVNIVWNHIGDGPMMKDLIALAEKRLGSKCNIHYKFWGKVKNNDILGIYNNIGVDLFITLTHTEGGAPVSMQEAFSIGVPAIGTAAGGITDLIMDGKTGYLLPINPTEQEVADTVSKFYYLTEKERRTMGENAYQHWKDRFDAIRNTELFVRKLENII